MVGGFAIHRTPQYTAAMQEKPIRVQVREFVLADGTVQRVPVKVLPPRDAEGATRQQHGRISNKATR